MTDAMNDESRPHKEETTSAPDESRTAADGTAVPARDALHRRLLRRLAVGAAAFCLLLVVAGTPLWLAWRGFTGPGPAPERAVVLIEEGRGLSAIAAQLEREGLITSALMFRLGVEVAGKAADLKAGEYRIPRHASMRQIMDILVDGKPILWPVTIFEGMTSHEAVDILMQQPFLSGTVPVIPAEGTLLPETYLVTRGTQRQEVIDRARKAQEELIARLWPQRRDGLPFDTVEEAIILASIVEKETGRGDERRKVAGVFINRLKRGMRLQSDPTIIYGITQGEGALGRRIRRSEIRARTPYNTYQIDGLPPTPICNPGAASIEAVLNPEETDYLFFVADGSGGHAFARTHREHERNVRKWRKIQRQRGQR